MAASGSAAQFFPNAASFRAWLEAHHDSETEIVVGFHRLQAGVPTMTWTESVREALCFGWIDGVVRKLDDTRFTRRFTPRTARSIWSAVNIRHAESLIAEGRMRPAGLAAFEARTAHRSAIYSFEQPSVELPTQYAQPLHDNVRARAFWEAQPPSYRKVAIWWVVSAKQETTRQRRLASLIDHCERNRRLPQFTSPVRKKD